MAETTIFPNGGELRWFGPEFLRTVEDTYVKKMLLRATTEVETIIQNMMREPKHGRVYRISGTKATYTASAPGEAPAIRTGRLRQSIRHVIAKSGPGEWTALIGTTVNLYPSLLEQGTKNMSARPMWKPALEKLKRRMPSILVMDRMR